VWVDVEDLEEPAATCEMCESQVIRFVHCMEHPDYPSVLRVGCICAGHMEGDVEAAKRREASMRSRASKRKRWLGRTWRTSKVGNPWILADGYHVVVDPEGSGWGAKISSGDYERRSKRYYATADLAKLAAFDVISARLARGG
jgi:hypothetical protein